MTEPEWFLSTAGGGIAIIFPGPPMHVEVLGEYSGYDRAPHLVVDGVAARGLEADRRRAAPPVLGWRFRPAGSGWFPIVKRTRL